MSKKALRNLSLVFDYLSFFAELVCLVLVLLVVRNEAYRDLFDLDSITELVLQTLVFLFLSLTVTLGQSFLIKPAAVFCFLATTTFSFLTSINSLSTLPSVFALSLLGGYSTLCQCLGDLGMALACIFFTISVLQEGAPKNCRIALLLSLSCLPFYLTSIILTYLNTSFDSPLVASLSLLSVLPILTTLSFFTSIDSLFYEGRVFHHAQKA